MTQTLFTLARYSSVFRYMTSFLSLNEKLCLASTNKTFCKKIVSSLWRTLTTFAKDPNAAEGPIPFAAFINTIDEQYPAGPNNLTNYFLRFQALQYRCAERGAILEHVSETLNNLLDLQREAQVNQDAALSAIWSAIRAQLPEAPHLVIVNEIRTWLKDPANKHFLQTVKSLNLLNLGLKVIPSEIGKLSRLQALYLSGNQIRAIPAEIGNLSKLQYLSLSRNQIRVIPAEIGNLSKLQYLILDHNQIRVISAEIGNLSKLQYLILDNNQISEIPPEIGNLSHLQRLYFENNQIRLIPAEIGNLSELGTFCFSHNKIGAIPAEIGNLSELLILDVSHNKIGAIPAEIGNLSKLQYLILDHNQISEIPPEIGNLSKLRGFYLNGNQISKIPPEIGNLSNLQVLYLRFNQIRFISDKAKAVLQKTHNASLLDAYQAAINYQAKSPFALLCQAIMKGETVENMRSCLDRLSQEDQDRIFYHVWDCAERPAGDPHWGEHHVFDNMATFFWAIGESINDKLQALPEQEKQRAYYHVWNLAGQPTADDPDWGKTHALNNLPRLADALHFVSASTQ